MSKLPSSPSAECSVTGDIHFTTFDGRRYTFPATCQYILAKSRSSGTFTVTLQNAPCGLVRLGGSPSSNKPPIDLGLLMTQLLAPLLWRPRTGSRNSSSPGPLLAESL